jgi:hypothetical protein
VGFDLDGMQRALGLENERESMTHRELQERRAAINQRVREGGSVL